MRAIVTGGAGFIGSNLVIKLVSLGYEVLTVDCLTYAGHLINLRAVQNSHNHKFLNLNLTNYMEIENAIIQFQPTHVFHLAAESHVDKSIDSARPFIDTNIVGTLNLVEALNKYNQKAHALLIHVSTDEVYGSIEKNEFMTEQSPYLPNSPYAASKAAADLVVRSFIKTHNLPAIICNCCNNFGYQQLPEKLIPLTILRAINNHPIPVYGDGLQERDWCFVNDHINALMLIAQKGVVGDTYVIGTENVKTNLDVITNICEVIDILKPGSKSRVSQISHVTDRPGHDRRYAISPTKIKALGFKSEYSFSQALKTTIIWYLENQEWCDAVGGYDISSTRQGIKLQS